MGAGRRQRRWKVAVRGDRQHFSREHLERRRSGSAPRARPRPPARSRDFFAPSDWRDLDRQDLDLGGTAPTPLDVASATGPGS